MANGYGQKDCPVARALDVIGERWSLLVPRNLFRKGPLYGFKSSSKDSLA